jgi:predicted polyphosphate/ATP-dependent NAD kinase
MTRKDYTVLAVDLNNLRSVIEENATEDAMTAFVQTVNVIVISLKRENGRFDRDRFMAAVGL